MVNLTSRLKNTFLASALALSLAGCSTLKNQQNEYSLILNIKVIKKEDHIEFSLENVKKVRGNYDEFNDNSRGEYELMARKGNKTTQKVQLHLTRTLFYDTFTGGGTVELNEGVMEASIRYKGQDNIQVIDRKSHYKYTIPIIQN